jgi:hypothetical protein
MKLGTFKGRAVKGSVQYGDSPGGHPQISLIMRMEIPGGSQDATTFLVFSEDNAPYCWERLRALGFKGDDLSQELVGIDNEVDVVMKADDYQGKTQVKCEIVAGGGLVKMAKPTSREVFAAKVKAITGGSAGAAPVGGGVRPPF